MNAKKELLDLLKEKDDKLVAAYIRFGYSYSDDDDVDHFTLYRHHTKEELKNFLNFIDREYDNGYGGQELFGTVWCEDGVWYERGEHDGSEWWKRHKYPEPPTELNRERQHKIERILK
jgi:hypothetical protein